MESANRLDTEMVLVLGTSGMLLLTAAIAIFIYLYQRKLIKKKLEYQRIEDLLKQQELKSAYAMLAGQEKAYKQIAEELHDNLGSVLVTLNMFTDSLQNKTQDQSQKELAAKISEIASTATEITRKISHSLSSGVLSHFGFETAVKDLAETINESGTVKVSLHIQITDLDTDLSLNLYRIIQELINNTLKHAAASKISLEINQMEDQLNLIYSDDGIGFDTQDPATQKGMGLKNLRSRVDRLEGSISVESIKTKGTTIILDIPLYGAN